MDFQVFQDSTWICLFVPFQDPIAAHESSQSKKLQFVSSLDI